MPHRNAPNYQRMVLSAEESNRISSNIYGWKHLNGEYLT